MPKPAADPAPDPAAPPVVEKPPVPRAGNKCPSCDGPTDGGRFCRDCGARLLPEQNGAREGGLEQRVVALETRMEPLAKLADTLKQAGVDVGAIRPQHVEQVKGMAGLFGGENPLAFLGKSLTGMFRPTIPAKAEEPPKDGGQ